jgi:hypothetical protein
MGRNRSSSILTLDSDKELNEDGVMLDGFVLLLVG